jgi:ribosomal-protein-alanine N-acetyltransferase
MATGVSLEVRKARPADWLVVESLIHRGRRSLSWPRLWEESPDHDLFFLVEREGVLVGALFARYDESPVAWVRLAALDDALDAGEWLDAGLPPILDELCLRGVQKLAWMDHVGWAGPYLEACGFERLTAVVTLTKLDRALPTLGDLDGCLRPASAADVLAVVAVDRAALSPHWWHSETAVRRRAAASAYFVAAEVTGAVVAYAEGELRPPAAHLNRIAVHPIHQGRGIGAFLLRDALRAFWRRGARQVTLNTQVDNHRSRRLYRRFGFEPTGDVVTAWELRIED